MLTSDGDCELWSIVIGIVGSVFTAFKGFDRGGFFGWKLRHGASVLIRLDLWSFYAQEKVSGFESFSSLFCEYFFISFVLNQYYYENIF